MVNDADGLPPYENAIAGVTIPFIGVAGDDEDRFTANDGASTSPSRMPATVTNPYLWRHRRLHFRRPASRRQRHQARHHRTGRVRLLGGWRDAPARARACPAPRWPPRRWPVWRRWSGRRIPAGIPATIKAAIIGTASVGQASTATTCDWPGRAGAAPQGGRHGGLRVHRARVRPASRSASRRPASARGSSTVVRRDPKHDHPEHVVQDPSGTT